MNPWHSLLVFLLKKTHEAPGHQTIGRAPAPPRRFQASSLVQNPNARARCEFGGRLPLGRAFCEVRKCRVLGLPIVDFFMVNAG